MALRFLSVLAAVLLLAACETAPKESGSASSEGGAAAATAPTPPTTAMPSGPSGMEKKELRDPQRELVLNVGDRVFFDFDKYNLKPKARETLEAQAAWMKEKENLALTVTIEGHCDERGTREYNLALGERRSNAVRDYLLALGINPNRVSTISYGKERPAVAGSNETAWAQNRRAVMVVDEPKVGS